jgi:hypothetical protein
MRIRWSLQALRLFTGSRVASQYRPRERVSRAGIDFRFDHRRRRTTGSAGWYDRDHRLNGIRPW